jgi:hypothetical protein
MRIWYTLSPCPLSLVTYPPHSAFVSSINAPRHFAFLVILQGLFVCYLDLTRV